MKVHFNFDFGFGFDPLQMLTVYISFCSLPEFGTEPTGTVVRS